MVRSKGEAGWRMHRCRCSQHVAGVTEGWNVADRGHVSGEGGGVKGAALGKVFKVVMDLFALFGFARHFSVSGLNSFFLHSQGSVNLNKNQLFFFCASISSPRIAVGFMHPMPQDIPRSTWTSSSPLLPLHTSHTPKIQIRAKPIPENCRKFQVGLKFLKMRRQKSTEPHKSKAYLNNL